MPGMKDQMFDVRGQEAAERLELLKEALNKAVDDSDKRRGRFVMKAGDTQRVIGSSAAANAQAERLAAAAAQLESVSKSLGEAEQAQLANSLAELQAMSKDITAGTFESYTNQPGVYPGNLKPYDLEAPAKILVPRFTPLRNEIPRVKGIGGAREFRRILGYTNAGIGGVPDQDIFFNSESTTGLPTFGTLALRRGQKIEYSMDDHVVAYVEASVSDSVTYKAQFSNLGFENTRALSQMALLWSHMLGEEKALLFGRGATTQGYSGAFNGGNGPSSALTVAAGAAGSAPGSTFAGTVTVQATYRAGVGETAASATQTAVTIASGEAIVVTIPTIPAGAYGVNYYVNVVTSTGGAPAVGSYFATFSQVPSGTISINPVSLVNTATVPTADNTSSAGYDGLLTVLTGGDSGYVSTSGYTVSSTGDEFAQDAFAGLYSSVWADPDEVWLNARQRRSLGDYLKETASTTAYRLVLNDTNEGNVGALVNGIYNESSPTNKLVDLRVHPYMPVGCAIVRSRTLDIPDSGIGDTSEVVSVQEYMSVEWPEIQFQYDASTYWLGTFVHYAPAWSGAVTGLS